MCDGQKEICKGRVRSLQESLLIAGTMCQFFHQAVGKLTDTLCIDDCERIVQLFLIYPQNSGQEKVSGTSEEIINCRRRECFAQGVGASNLGKICVLAENFFPLNIRTANGMITGHLTGKITYRPKRSFVLLQGSVLPVLLLENIKQNRGGIFFLQRRRVITGIGNVDTDIQRRSQRQQMLQSIPFLLHKIDRGRQQLLAHKGLSCEQAVIAIQ